MTRIKAILSLLYPPTKAKLHRLFHAALAALTVAGSVVLWVQGQKWGWSTWNQIEAQSVLVGTFVARWTVILTRGDALVDRLPIPDGTEVTQTTTQTTETVTTISVPEQAAPLARTEPTPVTVPIKRDPAKGQP